MTEIEIEIHPFTALQCIYCSRTFTYSRRLSVGTDITVLPLQFERLSRIHDAFSIFRVTRSQTHPSHHATSPDNELNGFATKCYKVSRRFIIDTEKGNKTCFLKNSSRSATLAPRLKKLLIVVAPTRSDGGLSQSSHQAFQNQLVQSTGPPAIFVRSFFVCHFV
jgi:hypothetical protein